MKDTSGFALMLTLLTVLSVVFLGAAIVGISAQALPPRRSPVPGRYVQFGLSTTILDTSTGYLCDAYPLQLQAPHAGLFPPCPQIVEMQKANAALQVH